MPFVTVARLVVASFVMSLAWSGCGSSSSSQSGANRGNPLSWLRRQPTTQFNAAAIRVVFRDGKAYAQQQGKQWLIAEVSQDELLWAPDGQHFAYVRRSAGVHSERYQLVIRNIRGDSINEFSVYRPGKPAKLDWIDDRQISYEAPPDDSGDAYVVHDANSGEILRVVRGNKFMWSPGRHRLAYTAGSKQRQRVYIDGQLVWPRKASRMNRQVLGDLTWSPDGKGLAFIEQRNGTTQLVVLLVVDDEDGDLTWPVPNPVTDKQRVFWANNQVFVGETVFQPQFAASWQRQ